MDFGIAKVLDPAQADAGALLLATYVLISRLKRGLHKQAKSAIKEAQVA